MAGIKTIDIVILTNMATFTQCWKVTPPSTTKPLKKKTQSFASNLNLRLRSSCRLDTVACQAEAVNLDSSVESNPDLHRGNGKCLGCTVEVLSWRRRRISAHVLISADSSHVWQVLTDYERLAEFIPNLIKSKIIPSPDEKGIYLLQKGIHRTMYWQIEARVVLSLMEVVEADGRILKFEMIDGDFKQYRGFWKLQSREDGRSCVLYYEVYVTPRFMLPSVFLERIIKADLPKNLEAIADRAVAVASGNVSEMVVGEIELQCASDCDKWGRMNVSSFFGKEYSCRIGKPCVADEIHLRRLADSQKVMSSITIKASQQQVWDVISDYERLKEFIPNLAESRVLSRNEQKVTVLQEGCKCMMYMVLHARVTLDITEIPYSRIQFKLVEGDFDKFEGEWTLEALGRRHTRLKYSVEAKVKQNMAIAEAIMEQTIHEDLPSNLCAIRDRVETLMCEMSVDGDGESDRLSSSLPGVSSRRGGSTVLLSGHNASNRSESTPCQQEKLKQQQRAGANRKGVVVMTSDADIELNGVKESEMFQEMRTKLMEFIAEHGTTGVMPTRPELRMRKRSDLEFAVRRSGGFESVAARLQLKMSYPRKPKRYWEDFDNIVSEISKVQSQLSCMPTDMPTRRSIINAGRYDLARALEKWGGLKEVACMLGLRLTSSKRDKDSGSAKGQADGDDKSLMAMGATPSPSASSTRRKRQLRKGRIAKSPVPDGQAQSRAPSPMKAILPSTSKWVNLLQKEDDGKTNIEGV